MNIRKKNTPYQSMYKAFCFCIFLLKGRQRRETWSNLVTVIVGCKYVKHTYIHPKEERYLGLQTIITLDLKKIPRGRAVPVRPTNRGLQRGIMRCDQGKK